MKKILIIISVLLLSGCDLLGKETIETKLNPGFDIINAGEIHEDTGCIILIDNEEFDMEVSSNNVNEDILGEYLITYSYQYEEIEYSCSRYVKVIDDISPVVSLNMGIDTIIVTEDFTDAGITYSDNYDSELEVVINGNVDTSVVGRYVITYQVTDDSSNTTEVVRIVNVID